MLVCSVDIVESKTQQHLPCTAKKKEKGVKKYRKERSGKERTSSSTSNHQLIHQDSESCNHPHSQSRQKQKMAAAWS